MPFYFLNVIRPVRQKGFTHCHSIKALTKPHFQRVMIPELQKSQKDEFVQAEFEK